MSAKDILAHPPDSPQPLPTYDDILNAPEDQWRDLVTQIDGNPNFYAAVRARKNTPKPKPKRRPYRPRSYQSTRNWSAATVLSQIAPAMAEALDRVNDDASMEVTNV